MVQQLFGLDGVDPVDVDLNGFNNQAVIPYGLTADHVKQSMIDFIDFLKFMNAQLRTKDIPRLEAFLMPAGFSSLVGEFMNIRIPRYCTTLVKNKYHNGHPDLIPAGQFPNNAILHATDGIEVKGSRNRAGWQGHNPENVWLMVFIFDANSANDEAQAVRDGRQPQAKPFRFVEVLGAKLEHEDWGFSGRSETSRRTITATVLPSGYGKMAANWIYRDPTIAVRRKRQQ